MAAGPWVGALLGMLGAEVIKVEPPAGDGTRWVAPRQRGMGTNFICLNVNKRCVTIDFKDPAGRALAKELAATCDVFIQNFRVGVIGRLGLDYPTLAAINPRLIYCAISGFGEVGPIAHAGCADYIMQAFSGFARLNGAPGDELEQFRFSGFIDLSTADVATQAILAALLEREVSGQGQKVELSMLEAALEVQFTRIAEALGSGVRHRPLGSESLGLAPDRAFATTDEPIFLTVQDERAWAGFCTALERPELAQDPRFAGNAERVANRAALNAVLEPIFAARPALWWLRVLQRHAVACGMAHHFEVLKHHAQVLDNGMMARLDTRDWGTVHVAGVPWRFSATPCAVRPSSRPDEDSEAVLAPLRAALQPAGRRAGEEPPATPRKRVAP
jgi:crotonobetainyl-CoA:carnitine CoA-transferase CaiB-like acyl-CoA transferase